MHNNSRPVRCEDARPEDHACSYSREKKKSLTTLIPRMQCPDHKLSYCLGRSVHNPPTYALTRPHETIKKKMPLGIR